MIPVEKERSFLGSNIEILVISEESMNMNMTMTMTMTMTPCSNLVCIGSHLLDDRERNEASLNRVLKFCER